MEIEKADFRLIPKSGKERATEVPEAHNSNEAQQAEKCGQFFLPCF